MAQLVKIPFIVFRLARYGLAKGQTNHLDGIAPCLEPLICRGICLLEESGPVEILYFSSDQILSRQNAFISR